MRRSALLLMALLGGSNLPAQRVQSPDAPWRTIRTEHYRIHYPERGSFEPFAREVAARIEGIHAQVVAWVGYASPRSVDVLIRDPQGESNGFAFPLLDRPFVELWPTPPEPESPLGHGASWPELLVTHELTHIHHLLRPQNRPTAWDRLLDLPLGPVARKAPRWVSEGYATLIEGRVTGQGRPHSAYRASVIRQWALEGKLPDYGAVSAMGGFRGGNMAYLLGSAYLEWLERKAGDPQVLRRFWKQLASRKRRSFDASFEATFGFRARDGYDRWRAEAVHDALELERRSRAAGLLREGAPFAKVDGEATDLAVSPDGTQLLARVSTERFRGLMVWDLAETSAPELASAAPDPEEAPDVRPALPPRKSAARLGRVEGAVPRKPVWTKDGVVFEYRTPDGEGVLTRHFGLWIPGKGWRQIPGSAAALPNPFLRREAGGIWNIFRGEEPVTRVLSAAWSPSPTPDGRALFYAQLAATGVEIRRLDLTLPPLARAELPVDPSPLAPATTLPPPDGPSLLPPPVPPPPSSPYGAWEEARSTLRSSAAWGPSGHAYQLGWGGGDILGRLSWHLLAGFGNAAGPRGGVAALAWRGWRWAPSLQLFSALQRPSRQGLAPVRGLDTERRGASLSFTFEELGTWPFTFRPFVVEERLDPLEPSGPTRGGTLGGEATLRRRWVTGERNAFRISAGLLAASIRGPRESGPLHRSLLRLQVTNPAMPFAVEIEAGRSAAAQDPFASFSLGGLESALLPRSVAPGQVHQATLPAFLMRGDRLRRGRLEIGEGLRAYLEHAVVWSHTGIRPPAMRVAGLEYSLDGLLAASRLEPYLGRLSLTAGYSRILDGTAAAPTLKGRSTATLSLLLRP
ncbi:MAG: hypothetical protein HY823_03365 [Acidobacteria bacterium]|nr:hypothetical protein [Acidobacteriota bacterium]